MAEHDVPGPSRYETIRALVVAEAGPGASDVVPVLDALCRSAKARLSVLGVAVSLASSTSVTSGVAAASDPGAHAHAELTFTVGEGPVTDAVAMHRPVLVSDLGATSARWPGYAAVALAAGLGAVFAFPLQVGGVVLGVLEAYVGQPGSLGEERLDEALAYVQVATDVLLDGRLLTTEGTLEPGLASALDHRAEIHQAQGMLMVSLGITLTEALVLMRSHAFGRGRPLIDVAREIQQGGRLEDDAP